ncbi:M15 family metallopeptidase [Streptomyces sp. Ag109_O5-1]|uniref:M15 family metallopeptidase n=1 Tax=Streptomyces sp. Ag109_O5-1 TaxID=1938851 RepID=UPI0021A64F7F|nr:M15 family metallopeptidase [Streptomyces sp. Ag109_O5-1]
MIDGDRAALFRVEGANAAVPLLKGDVATVLLHVARRFSYEIDMLRPGDVQGHTGHRTVGAGFESNHLSGTAIAIRPLFYPLGAQRGTGLSDLEKIVVADILADCQGVIAWGGNAKPVKESHFQIDVRPGDPGLARLARRIRGEDTVPGSGAGSIDPFLPDRRKKAAAYL